MSASRGLFPGWAAAFCMLVVVSSAEATPQRVDVWGTVRNVLGDIHSVSIGQPFELMFVYDPSCPAVSWSTSTHARYRGPLLSGSFNVGNGTYAATDCIVFPPPLPQHNEIQIGNSVNDFVAVSAATDCLTAPPLDGHSLYSWAPLHLIDYQASAFQDVQLGPTLPPCTQFEDRQVDWSFHWSGEPKVLGHVSGYTVTPIPEPATLGLLGLGGLALAWARQRR